MYRIGIDLGGTNIAAGLVDEGYHIIHKDKVPTNVEGRTGEAIVDDIAALCRRLCEAKGVALSDVQAIGIATPGLVNSKLGTVEYANNLPFRRFPLCALLKERLGVTDVHAENDANAAAYGESIAGAAKGTTTSVMITLGTGVGGGIIINGQVYSGFNHAGGELGHIVIEKDGAPCTCGRCGCWEAYSSATALIRMTKEKMEECEQTGRETLLHELVAKKGKISGKTAFDGMRAGDAASCEVVDTYLSYLATGLTNIVNIFQPQVISIGGGISAEGDSLLAPLVPIIRKEQYGGSFSLHTKLRIAELGNDAGIIGAAFLGI